ncbi:MAG: DUF4259 domain-containing protein [Pseudomonadota bacterium]
MGASGVSWDEDDGALDWVQEYETDGLGAITRAFDAALEAEDGAYLDGDIGAAVIAAAQYVAAARDGDHALLETHPPVTAEIAEHPNLDGLAARALAALARILDEDASELFDLWNENDALFGAWSAGIDALQARLS